MPRGPTSWPSARELSRVTEGSLWAGIAALATARHLGEVGAAVQDYIDASGHGYGILREYVGHGIGRKMHESPSVFNYRVADPGAEVRPGLAVAIEPMVVDRRPGDVHRGRRLDRLDPRRHGRLTLGT